jgi:phosphoserine phosphatase
MKKVRFAIFDMEGTIFKCKIHFCHNGREYHGGIWTLLCDILGEEARLQNQKNWERWKYRNDPDYPDPYKGYSQWVEDTILLHRRYGLTRSQFQEVINAVPYFAGVAETFAALRRAGVRIALVSGGLKALADRVTLDHRLDYCFAAAEYYWTGEELYHWNIHPTDYEHKKSLVELLHRDLGITKEECLFVGDGDNDREVAEYLGHAIAFNPSGEKLLEQCCPIIIRQDEGQEDLSEILKHISF